MPTLTRTEYKDGKRITTRFVPLSMCAIFARIAVARALPQIQRGNVPATEADIDILIERGAIAIVFLAMTVEAAANQFGEDAFAQDFDDFDRCRGRFSKDAPEGPQGMRKWFFLMQTKGRESDFVAKIVPGLTKLFEARHVLVHYKMTEHAEKWVAEAPILSDSFRVFYSAGDKFVKTESSVLAAFGAAAIHDFYTTVRALFTMWYEANGDDPAKLNELLPPVAVPS